jgi:hypothetical protein
MRANHRRFKSMLNRGQPPLYDVMSFSPGAVGVSTQIVHAVGISALGWTRRPLSVLWFCLLGAIRDIPTRCPNVSGTRRLGYTSGVCPECPWCPACDAGQCWDVARPADGCEQNNPPSAHIPVMPTNTRPRALPRLFASSSMPRKSRASAGRPRDEPDSISVLVFVVFSTRGDTRPNEWRVWAAKGSSRCWARGNSEA